MAGTGGVLGPFTKGSKQDPPANVTLNAVPQLPDVSFKLEAMLCDCNITALQQSNLFCSVHACFATAPAKSRRAMRLM
jgi:hypothetical protein